jgi:hypothetical protein
LDSIDSIAHLDVAALDRKITGTRKYNSKTKARPEHEDRTMTHAKREGDDDDLTAWRDHGNEEHRAYRHRGGTLLG